MWGHCHFVRRYWWPTVKESTQRRKVYLPILQVCVLRTRCSFARSVVHAVPCPSMVKQPAAHMWGRGTDLFVLHACLE